MKTHRLHAVVKDRGQRYEVTYLNIHSQRVAMGWTNDLETTERMVNTINEHPCWAQPQVEDRQKGE